MLIPRHLGFAIVLSSLSLAVAIPAKAASFTNGNFETGDFTGWTTVGNALVYSTQYYPHADNGGKYEAIISSYDAGSYYTKDVSPSSLESQLGLTPGSLKSVNSNVLSGSGIAQSVTLDAGQSVSFQYDFLTNETPGNTKYNDFAFFQASSNTSYSSPLATIASVANSKFNNTTIAPDFLYDTGFKTYDFTATTAGTYTIKLGVTNVGPADGTVTTGGDSDSYPSGILVDNFVVTAVPEPSFTLGALSLLAVGILTRQYRRYRNN